MENITDADTKEPITLLLGNVDYEGISSTLTASGRRYKIKRLHSSAENWVQICTILETENVTAVIIKLTATIYSNMVTAEYHVVRDRMLALISSIRHIIFVHEELYASPLEHKGEMTPVAPGNLDNQVVPTDDDEPDLWGDHFASPPADVVQTVNELMSSMDMNVVAYKKNAEITLIASRFISDTDRGLLLRVYIPTGRIWAQEMDRLLILFRDYLGHIGHKGVALEQRRTEGGVVYEFHATTSGTQLSTDLALAGEFQDFSQLLDLSLSNPEEAARILRNRNVQAEEIVSIITRYSKEAKRLHTDIRQERERKVLSIRHRLESELVDTLPAEIGPYELDRLVDAVVPRVTGTPTDATLAPKVIPLQIVANTGGEVIINIEPRTVNALNSIVAEEIYGDVRLGLEARQILDLFEEFADRKQAAVLRSQLYEVLDPSASKANRLMSANRIKAFMLQIASKIPDVGVGLLTSYLEKLIGLGG